MAQVVWTEPALADLDAIADYVAVDKPEAARHFVQTVLDRVALLAKHPRLGKVPAELRGMPYRELVVAPCRIFYRSDGRSVFVVHVMRGERMLRPGALERP